MPKYQVTLLTINEEVWEVEADNNNDAIMKAKNADGLEISPSSFYDHYDEFVEEM